jgi:hypothetical protein
MVVWNAYPPRASAIWTTVRAAAAVPTVRAAEVVTAAKVTTDRQSALEWPGMNLIPLAADLQSTIIGICVALGIGPTASGEKTSRPPATPPASAPLRLPP